jgi:hypothetical protein
VAGRISTLLQIIAEVHLNARSGLQRTGHELAAITPSDGKALARSYRLRNNQRRSGEITKMKIRVQGTLVLVVVAVLAGSLPAAAQQVDQPASTLRSRIKAKYIEKRDRFLHRTKDLYFAVGCKVLASEAGILPLTSSESYLAFVGDQTIVDTKDESLRQAAAQEGLARATRPGECDYYRRHPEAAEAARRAAAEASAKR